VLYGRHPVPKPVAYVAVVNISPKIKKKIGAADHGHVADWEVREAVVLCDVTDSWWAHDHERGWRLIIEGTTAAGREVVVALYAVDEDDGTWNLGTAYVRE
jgi:hypothetical protein